MLVVHSYLKCFFVELSSILRLPLFEYRQSNQRIRFLTLIVAWKTRSSPMNLKIITSTYHDSIE